MSDSAENDAGWAQAWIEQQRALLDQVAQSGPGQAAGMAFEQVNTQFNAQINVMASQWADLGKTYLNGLMQMAQGTGGTEGGAKFQPAGEVFDAWKTAWTNSLSQAAAPGGWSDLLNRTPPLGLFREQTEAWRAVAAARADVERLEQELAAVLRRVQADALSLLEERVKARAASNQPVEGFRDLYNLWVECSEKVFSTVAHSSAYCHLQGELGNASMRLRARVQKVIEQGLRQFDLPTRSEVNSVHQQLRLLKQRLATLEHDSATVKGSVVPPAPSPPKRRPSMTSGASGPSRPSGAKRKTAPARPARKRSR